MRRVRPRTAANGRSPEPSPAAAPLASQLLASPLPSPAVSPRKVPQRNAGAPPGGKAPASARAAASSISKKTKAAAVPGGVTRLRAALVVLALAGLAAVGWLHTHPPDSTALQLPGGLPATAAARAFEALSLLQARGRLALWEASQQLQGLAEAAWDAYELRLAQLLSSYGGGGSIFTDHDAQHGSFGSSGGHWDASEIVALLPDGAAWQEVAADIAERLRGDGAAAAAAPGRKGTGLLLRCVTAAGCAESAAALGELSGPPPGCTLQLDGAAFGGSAAGSPAAALQAALAPFLRRCPAGLVVLRDAQLLSLDALPALHSALSELGGFQHGGAVDASRAAYALLYRGGGAAAARHAARMEPAEAAAALKAEFFEGLLGAELARAADAERASSVLAPMLRALRRRVDFAAPLRLGAGEAAEAEGYAAAAAEAEGHPAAAAAAAEAEGHAAAAAAAAEDEGVGEGEPYFGTPFDDAKVNAEVQGAGAAGEVGAEADEDAAEGNAAEDNKPEAGHLNTDAEWAAGVEEEAEAGAAQGAGAGDADVEADAGDREDAVDEDNARAEAVAGGEADEASDAGSGGEAGKEAEGVLEEVAGNRAATSHERVADMSGQQQTGVHSQDGAVEAAAAA
ncbi:hypothetical protein MNEG_10684 [Monoraphidium neglectum]|uniref:Uncharacterized protein n=1 Tax=Monoraphidium neglectum TaxID=145388 RepID=A0A0D2JC59_9CHLO|nr:hypothetical protein MNEG_10684 [Monoraphidium neglectum]KIY97277.1 hypothetical protein MNEG_10684 [Monoraphidium neglectum]|eukprot:XP_013896297.1 hypothetical protein MNEG_10684 [Monoraphidium neglectum]